jgi:ferric-dicitrate binding protein FerR (iron transport regulator)
LAYKTAASNGSKDQQVVYNTLRTPRGGQYEIILPDGSKVWLNAASSLHYPVAFAGTTRTVEITGEGYFEIAPDPQKPFIVKVGDDEKIEVLGTRFNVNSYPEEGEIRTTLQDGSIRISGGGKSILLKPSEAVEFDKATGKMEVGPVNVNAVIAWKNGLFYFDNTNIKEIMEQVSRWYNINIVYETRDLGHKIYSGTLPRYSDVSALLKMLEMTGTVHFRIDGRTITVLN